MRRSWIIGGFILALILMVPIQVQARHGRVLGTETDNSRVDLATTQGPGLLLPNSPLYFIDIWRDNLALLLTSFDREAKARLHLKIAGERITEVKVMLEAKDVNARGLDIALANITENVAGAAQALKEQKNKGKNVEELALELNSTVDAQQVSLRVIAKAHGDEFRLKIKAVQKGIDDEEREIEDELAEDKLEDEIEDELNDRIEEELEEVENAAEAAVIFANQLEQEASAAGKSSKIRLELRQKTEETRDRASEASKKARELKEEKSGESSNSGSSEEGSSGSGSSNSGNSGSSGSGSSGSSGSSGGREDSSGKSGKD